MPAFVCTKCGHYANTAISNYWTLKNPTQKAMCHACLVEGGYVTGGYKKLMDRPRFDKAPEDLPKGVILK